MEPFLFPSLPRKPLDLEPWPPSDPFLVDDLLDFSNDDIAGPIGDDSCAAAAAAQLSDHSTLRTCPVLSFDSDETCSLRTPGASDAQAPASGEPSYTQPDELAELEWLSTFVEDSYVTDKTLTSVLNLNSNDEKRSSGSNDRQPHPNKGPVSVVEESNNAFSQSFSSRGAKAVVKARSRGTRSRTGGRVWSLHMLLPISPDRYTLSEDLDEDSESSSLDYEGDDCFRQSKKPSKGSHAKKIFDNLQARRCTHCQVQKTPQWRAGPLGPKTLCNACGVRYKSGRLVPEYRPAGSPSFVSEVHSNSHKKILEMRQLREQIDLQVNAASDISGEHEELNVSEESVTSIHTKREAV